MKVTIYNYKKHGNNLTYDKVESINEVGVRDHIKDTRGIVINLNIDYAMERSISYIQYINRADFSRIEIH